jgi:AcrR family transcriptional regulator
MLALFEEGVLKPTAPVIAERAGVSIRSVFQHFADLESLYADVSERQMARLFSTATFIPRDGNLKTRLGLFVRQRARVHETVTPVRRAALLVEPFSDEVAGRLRWVRDRGRSEVERVFAIELKACPARERIEIVEALTAASSWSAWEALRAHQGLTPSKAESVMSRTIAAILGSISREGQQR